MSFFESFIPPYIVGGAVFYVLILLFLTVILTLFILIFHKARIEYRERKKNRLMSKYNHHLKKYMFRITKDIKKPKTKLGAEALSLMCIDLLESVDEFDETRLKDFIKDSSLVSYYKKMAKSSLLSKRFHAIKKLGFFRLDELKDYFVEFLLDENTIEGKGSAVWALSMIADQDALDLITRTLSSEITLSSKFNEYVYSNVIQSFKRNSKSAEFLAFLENLKTNEEVPLLLKRDIIQACGSSHFHEASRVILDLSFLYDENPVIKIASMRALGRLKCPEFCGVVTTAFFHEDWRVRVAASQAATMCETGAISHLRNLLYDDFYYVRINAAKALSELGEQGIALLRREINSEDPFVRDTVQFMLKEKA